MSIIYSYFIVLNLWLLSDIFFMLNSRIVDWKLNLELVLGGRDTLSKKTTVEIDITPFWKGIYSKREEFGSKFFPFRVDPFANKLSPFRLDPVGSDSFLLE